MTQVTRGWRASFLQAGTLLTLPLAALAPLLDNRFLQSHDGYLHMLRAVELDWLLKHGILWPRYAPDLAYGYGYPLFNFQAPLSYYLVVGFHWLGLDFAPAFYAAFACILLTGTVGVFYLAKEFFGEWAGYVAGGAYAFSPYILFDLIARGAMPELMGVACLPWLIWSLRRASVRPSRWAMVRLGICYGVMFVHNVIALIGTALVVIFIAGQMISWLKWPEHRVAAGGGQSPERGQVASSLFQRVWPPVAGVVCALAAAAFFWIPALFEINSVSTVRVTTAGYDVLTHFVQPADLLALPRAFDPRLVQSNTPLTLGMPQAALALVGLLALRRYPRPETRYWGGVFFVLLIGLAALTLPQSALVWKTLPLMKFFQFPWRLLGPASVFAAVLAGAAFGALPLEGRPGRLQRALPACGLALLGLHACSWTYTFRQPPVIHPSLDTLHATEAESGQVGLTSVGEFLPRWVQAMPAADGLRDRYAANAVIDRLNAIGLPPSVDLLSTQSQLLAAQATFEASTPFEAEFLWFYFPGWRAEVDGQPADIRVTEPYGFISVPVPEGHHQVGVYFGSTPLRRWATAITLVGLVGWVVLALRRWKDPRQAPATTTQPAEVSAYGQLNLPVRLSLVAAGLALFVFRIGIGERDSPFFHSRFDGQTVQGAGQSLDFNFGNALDLIAVNLPAPSGPADQPVRFGLYWRLHDRPVAPNYSVAVHLVDTQGHIWGADDRINAGDLPTSRWPGDKYAQENHQVVPDTGAPPGKYRLLVGVYPPNESRVPVFNQDGVSLGDMVEIAQVILTGPAHVATDAELAPSHWIRAQLGGMELLGIDFKTQSVKVGDGLSLVAYWRVGPEHLPDLNAWLEWVGPEGRVYKLGRFAPIRDDYPSSQWLPGAGLKSGPRGVQVPADVPGGEGQLRLSMETADGSQYGEPVSLAPLTIVAPTRQFTMPMTSRPLNLRFGAEIVLRGADWPGQLAAGQPLTVTLAWEARQVTSARITVFVHALDAEGNKMAQHDSQPANGGRATTSWLPGEYVVDEHVLALPTDLPPGPYRVVVGMYDSYTGRRLQIQSSDGQAVGDSASLGEVEVK